MIHFVSKFFVWKIMYNQQTMYSQVCHTGIGGGDLQLQTKYSFVLMNTRIALKEKLGKPRLFVRFIDANRDSKCFSLL